MANNTVTFLNGTLATFPNGTLINPLIISNDICNLTICPLEVIVNGITVDLAHTNYIPSLAGNAFYLAVFVALLIAQGGLGIFYRTWGFGIGMFGGLILEIVGYAGRVQMSQNPFGKTQFLMYLVTLTIGPAFLSAAIYLCLARIVVIYGEELSRFRPRTYTIVFISCDFLALVLQAAGGALASSATTKSSDQTGINIMIAGLSWQVVSLTVFSILALDFAWKVYRSPNCSGETFAPIVASMRFKGFLISLVVATIAILIRSSFRVAELSQGFHGALANNEVTFMILEGCMVIIAVTVLTVFHPGFAFKGAWHEASWGFKTSKGDKEVGSSSSDEEKKIGTLRRLSPFKGQATATGSPPYQS